MKTTISRWGKSLGIRLPTETVKALDLASGEKLSIEINDSAILLKPMHHKNLLTQEDFRKILSSGPKKIKTRDDFEGMRPRGKEIW